MTAAVDVRDAFRIYRSYSATSVALQGLTLTVEPGEIVVVLGPSGSGKTTLLRAVAAFETLSAGSVRVFGQELGALSAKARAAVRASNIGFLDQHYLQALSPELRCRDTVALQLGLLGHAPPHARRVAEELLDEVGLAERVDDRPQMLSGGEQQRVAVCAAIAHGPRLLLADEPAGELDGANAAAVYALLGELTRAARASALIVSHDSAAAEIADRLVHIRDGRLVEQALPGEAPALVVSGGGWLRVPTGFFDELGRPNLVAAEPRDGGVLLRTAARYPARTPTERRPPATPSPDGSGTIVHELRKVAKSYRSGRGERVVFSGLSRRVKAGSLLAVVGRSGTGKTTLLHLMAGLERPSAGHVLFLGQPLSEMDRSDLAALRRRHMALVTQEPGLVPYLTARENVALGLALRGDTCGQEARAQSALEDVGLGQRLDHRVSSLSAGERQRVAIARALASDVGVLLVDEPTARLDEENGRAIGELLAAAARKRGRAVVCATHDHELVKLADEVLELDDGLLPPARRRLPNP
jgi:ABC-type lipoprotein export system ATPase subunit